MKHWYFIIFQCFLPHQKFNPSPDMPFLGSSDSTGNENVMSKIKKNAVQLSDCKENVVGKGEIACYEQFLLCPQCFQKLSVIDTSK